jgi:hypothetical protein
MKEIARMTDHQLIRIYLWDGESADPISDEEFLEQLKAEQEALTQRVEESKFKEPDKPVVRDYQDLYAWRWKLQGKTKDEIKAKWEKEFPNAPWRE